MDDELRHLQRHYQQGDITTLEWLIALRRGGQQFAEQLIQYWQALTSNIQHTLPSVEEYRALSHILELLRSFPLACTCSYCFRQGRPYPLNLCQCCITGRCYPEGPGSLICPRCKDGCVANFGDGLWVRPGVLAVELEEPRHGNRVRPICHGYHYESPRSDESDFERGSLYASSTHDKLLFIVRHAICRYEPDVPEEDDETREWRNMLSDLRPGEFPPG